MHVARNRSFLSSSVSLAYLLIVRLASGFLVQWTAAYKCLGGVCRRPLLLREGWPDLTPVPLFLTWPLTLTHCCSVSSLILLSSDAKPGFHPALIALVTSPSQSFTGRFVSFPCKFLGRRIFDKLSLVLFTHHGPNRVFKTCQSQAQSNKWCLDYFVVLGTVLVAGTNYPPRK